MALIIQEMQHQESSYVPKELSITWIYQTFLETDLVEDRSHSRKPSTMMGEKFSKVKKILLTAPTYKACKIAHAANLSKYEVNRIMWSILRFKTYMIQSFNFYTMQTKILMWQWRKTNFDAWRYIEPRSNLFLRWIDISCVRSCQYTQLQILVHY